MRTRLFGIVRFLVFFSPLAFPAYLLRFKLAGVPFTALEIFTYALAALWLAALARGRTEMIWNCRTRKYWLAALMILASASAGVILAPNLLMLPDGNLIPAKIIALGIWKGWLFAPLLYFALLTQILRTAADAERILRQFVFSAALVSLAAYGFAFFDQGITVDFRLRGFFESANYLALYLVPALLISFHFFLTRRALNRRHLLNLSCFVVLLYTLFFTQSYAGILAVFGSLGLYVLIHLFQSRRRRKTIGLALGILAIVFAAVVMTQLNTPKFRQFLDFGSRSSTSVRMEIYRTAIRLIRDHPVLGLGPGLFQPYYQRTAPDVLGRVPMEWNMPHPHNLFLGFWLNAGMIGLLAFLTLIFLCHRPITYPLIALWGILIHGLFDMPFWKNDLAMIFWLVAACVLVMQKENFKF